MRERSEERDGRAGLWDLGFGDWGRIEHADRWAWFGPKFLYYCRARWAALATEWVLLKSSRVRIG
jgi:hypothetical protein